MRDGQILAEAIQFGTHHLVALTGQRHGLVKIDWPFEPFGNAFEQGPLAGDRLQTSAPAAMTLPPIGRDGNVAHFAREAAVAGQKQMIDHHAQSDARAHIEHGEAVEIARFAVHVFGQAQGMRVVDQRTIGIETLAQILAKFLAVREMADWRPDEFPAVDSRRGRRH